MGACVIIFNEGLYQSLFYKGGAWGCLKFGGCEGETWFGVEGVGRINCDGSLVAAGRQGGRGIFDLGSGQRGAQEKLRKLWGEERGLRVGKGPKFITIKKPCGSGFRWQTSTPGRNPPWWSLLRRRTSFFNGSKSDAVQIQLHRTKLNKFSVMHKTRSVTIT